MASFTGNALYTSNALTSCDWLDGNILITSAGLGDNNLTTSFYDEISFILLPNSDALTNTSYTLAYFFSLSDDPLMTYTWAAFMGNTDSTVTQ